MGVTVVPIPGGRLLRYTDTKFSHGMTKVSITEVNLSKNISIRLDMIIHMYIFLVPILLHFKIHKTSSHILYIVSRRLMTISFKSYCMQMVLQHIFMTGYFMYFNM